GGTRAALPLASTLPAPPPAAGLARLAPLSWRVECSLGAAAEASRAEEERADLVRRLERRLRAAEKLLAELRAREEAGAAAERLRQDGELLKGALGGIARGQRELTVPDWFAPGAPPRTIALDPRLSPRENLARLFARYQKLERARERRPGEIALAEAARIAVRDLLDRAADPAADPAALAAEAQAGGWLPPRQEAPARRAEPAPRLPYHRFTGLRGSEIRVGRSARDNDRLSFREARGNDLWLHTSEAPGSHVVLRLEKGRDPDPEEVLDAAHLAVHFSPLRGAERAEVHVARVKELRKPKKAPPGLVSLTGGKVRRIRLEPARLARLLRGEREAPPGAPGCDPA
ncbi:MAG: NFACT RNA binding domain-containing protein, partial [Planctomycetota bacterium]